MKLKIDRTVFLRALTHAQSIVERRTTIPILAHVLLLAKEGSLTLTATDLDLSYTETLAADVMEPGEITAPVQMLYDVMRKMSSREPVEMTVLPHDAQMRISTAKSEFLLPTLAAVEFPLLHQGELPFHFSLTAKDIRGLIDSTRFAMATEETRYYLNGLYWHTADEVGKLRVVATDGHRLSRSEIQVPEGARGMPGVILSRKTVGEIRKIIDEVEEDVSISLSDVQMRFSFGQTSLVSRLIDGEFPDYQQVIPQHNDRLLVMKTKEFGEAVDRVAIITSERSRAVKLSLSHNQLIVSASSLENGSAKEELAVIYDSESLDIGFNAKYVLDVVSHLKGQDVEFVLSDSSAPVIVRDLTSMGTLFVLMPMRV